MTPKQIGGGPAFPGRFEENYMINGKIVNNGLSRRDWFATHAPLSMKEAWAIWTDHKKRPMREMLGAGSERSPFLEWFAAMRFEYADAMLKEAAGE